MKNLALVTALFGALVLAGCNGSGGDPTANASPTPPDAASGTTPKPMEPGKMPSAMSTGGSRGNTQRQSGRN